MNTITAIASWEFRNAVRTRWIAGCGAAFALCTTGVVVLGMRSVRELGLTGAGPAVTSLLGIAMLFPPLIGLLLGAGSIAGPRERRTLQMVLAQPDGRRAYVAGAFLGLASAMWAVLAAGLGIAGLMLIAVAEVADLRALLGLVVATFGAATVAVAMGMFVSSLCRTRAQATAWCVVLWFFFAMGADLLLISLVPVGDLGPGAMFIALLANPVEAARTLALLIIDPSAAALGPFGTFMTAELGVAMATAFLVGALFVWSAVSLLAARRVLTRADI